MYGVTQSRMLKQPVSFGQPGTAIEPLERPPGPPDGRGRPLTAKNSSCGNGEWATISPRKRRATLPGDGKQPALAIALPNACSRVGVHDRHRANTH
jgi:hypothetical protein